MPRFTYVVRNSKGEREMGVEEAPSQDELVARLQSRELVVVNVFPEGETIADKISPGAREGVKAREKLKHYRVTSEDLVLFSRQLATLIGAGVTILRSLDIISLQVSSRQLYQVTKRIEKDMEGGLSLHQAISKHPRIFSELWVNLIESGEASGSLAIVLSRLALYLERDAAFRRKIVSALIYPIILLCAGIAALLVMALKIIPTFAEVFKGFNMKLPLLTQILVEISDFLRHRFLLLIFGAGILIYLIRKYIATPVGRRQFENFLFKLPLFGEFFRSVSVEKLTAGLNTLLESGVPILYSFEIAERSVENLVLSDIVRKIKDDIRSGKNLGESFKKSGFFDPMVVQMVGIGEEIGELPQMFKKVNAYYQEYTETFLTRIISLFEPIILVIVGAIIGTMVIGMFLPIFQIARFGT